VLMCSCKDFGMFVNVPSLSASARSSGRVDKRWQSFLNYQLSTTKLAAAQGPGRLAGSFSGGVVGAYTDTPPSHDGTEGQD
jgi:hypothetical protein